MSFKIVNREAVLNTADVASDDAWIRAARLKDKINKGDKKAQKEFDKMERTKQVKIKM